MKTKLRQVETKLHTETAQGEMINSDMFSYEAVVTTGMRSEPRRFRGSVQAVDRNTACQKVEDLILSELEGVSAPQKLKVNVRRTSLDEINKMEGAQKRKEQFIALVKESKWSHEQIAEKLSVTRNYVQMICEADSCPSEALLKLFQMKAHEVIKDNARLNELVDQLERDRANPRIIALIKRLKALNSNDQEQVLGYVETVLQSFLRAENKRASDEPKETANHFQYKTK